MYLSGHIEVTIANKLLKTIVSVHVKNDGHQIGSDCTLVLPLISTIQYKDGSHDFLTQYSVNSQQTFAVGDPILITASYDGYPQVTLFKGFLFDFVEGTPMTIKCLDYSYFFNLGMFGTQRVFVKQNKKGTKGFYNAGAFYASIKLKDLLQNIVNFVNDTIDGATTDTDHVVLFEPGNIPDITLVNITFAMMSPLAILNYFRKELLFNITLMDNQLYCNVASTTISSVTYRSDTNVLKCDLQKPEAVFQTFKVKAYFLQNNGLKDSIEVGDTNGKLVEVFFTQAMFGGTRNVTKYTQLANEALNKAKQRVYGGTITTLLYPMPILFAKANYTDIRYPDRTGNYVTSGYETTVDASGYRHKVKFSYLTQKFYTNE